MKHRWRGQSGFTIVELLIVIVVIGILAGLVLNTYSGIQSKARDTQVRVAADTLAKALVIWAADTGLTPYQAGADNGSSGTIGGNGLCTGGDGRGWMQKTKYPCSMEEVLIAGGYINNSTLSGLPENKKYAGTVYAKTATFMLYNCGVTTTTRKWVLFYALENQTPQDKASLQASEPDCSASATVDGSYGMKAAKVLDL